MNHRPFQISSVPRVHKRGPAIAFVILAFFASVSISVAGDHEIISFEETRSDTLTAFRTHEQFVRLGVDLAVDGLFQAFSFSRPKPVWITPAEGQAPNHWFEEAAARVLFDQGFIVREGMDKDTADARIWAIRYRFDRFSLSLPQSRRHKFMGKIWVQRLMDEAILVHVWDLESDELLWSNTSNQRVSDWIPKRELPELSQISPPLESPVAPVTTAERLTEPVLIGAAVGALTILFFAVR
jgi:hypothetical protein